MHLDGSKKIEILYILRESRDFMRNSRMSEMKFSIIIPMYNAETTIERCVASFLEQKYSNIELIMVDDHSTDNTYDICLGLREKYEQIQLYQSPEKGVSAARNLGMQHVSGDIIAFCDSDDTTVENSLFILSSMFEKYTDVDVIVSGYNRVALNGEVVQSFVYSKIKFWSSEQFMHHVLYDQKIMGSVCNKFFRKEILDEIKFDTTLSMCEDMHFLCKTLANYKQTKILRLNSALYNYYENTSSATNSLNKIFNADGKIEYVISLEAIIRDCKMKGYAYWLARRAMFVIASDTFINFEVSEEQKKEVLKIMKENSIIFCLLGFISPKSNIGRILRLFMRGIKK